MAENKKDAFTFSDKIKNSKPAFNPFSKRVSSKIGNNGKPKKTLFERTRRDAPFFIAAVAALLVLPFLYKYSGTVEDEGAVVAPGMSDTVFDPERFDFSPSTEDPSGQIAQLAGRDPLSLIKGWGTETTTRYSVDDRDGLADYSVSRPTSNRTSSVSSSSYRRTAPAATRAAFKRNTTPTKINEMRGAALNARGGGNIGSRFGGANLKNAASKNSAAPVRNPTKPVSLQPLRAAGSPSRSYYGQDGVRQARASREALSKADAVTALKDAVFNPIGQGRVGGLADGFFAAGGGSGKMEHNMDYKGITPWWWDMMKQREQEKWNYRYHLWRDPWKEAVKVGGTKFFSCLLWGTDDGDMGSVFGTPAKDPEAAKCTIYEKDYSCEDAKSNQRFLDAFPKLAAVRCSDDDSYKAWCKSEEHQKSDTSTDWIDGSAGSARKGIIRTRLDCLGTAGKKSKKSKQSSTSTTTTTTTGGDASPFGSVSERMDCASVKNPNFAQGINYELEMTGMYADRKPYIGVFARTRFLMPGTNEQAYLCGEEAYSCLVYMAEGNILDWADAQAQITAMLDQQYPGQGEEIFRRLLFTTVDSSLFEEDKALPTIPMTFIEYVKWQSTNDGYVGPSCAFPVFQIKAQPPVVKDSKINAILVYDPVDHGNGALSYNDIEVNCVSDDSGTKVGPQKPIANGVHESGAVGLAEYNAYEGMDQAQADAVANDMSDGQATFTWTAEYGGQISTDILDYDGSGDVVVVPPTQTQNECVDGETLDGEEEINGEKCATVAECVGGFFGTPRLVDPKCGQTNTSKTPTPISDKISAIPQTSQLANDLDNRLNGGGNAKWPDCKIDDLGGKPLLVADAETKALVKKAAETYKKNTGSELTYDENNLKVANVLDAMMILGENSAPKNTVCMIGKTIGGYAMDPSVKDPEFDNMFGMFAAFIDINSSFFPTNRYKKPGETGNGDYDPRFVGCKGSKEIAGGPGKQYHYGHYNWSEKKYGDRRLQKGREPYIEVLKEGPWGSFPLAELAKDFGYITELGSAQTTNKTVDDANRIKYHKAYQKVFQKNVACDYTGNMSAEKAFEYIGLLCENGSDIKPVNSKKPMDCNSYYQESQFAASR